MTTLDTLRQLLAEATPGPWEYPELIFGHPNTSVLAKSDKGVVVIGITHPADARLISAAPTHLAELITALEREAKVRELHKAETVHAITGYDCCNEDCDHEGECPAEPIEVCAECNRIAEESYQYFGENGLGNVLYPCPTIRILDGNE